MTFTIKSQWIAAGVVTVIGVFGIGYGLGQRKKLNDISDKLDRSIKDLKRDTEIEIADDILSRAIEESVDEQVEQAVNKVSKRIDRELYQKISSDVSAAISAQYSDIKTRVRDEVEKKVGQIDVSGIRREVVERAKNAAVEKLDGSMDDILSDFKNNLQNITKVYESLSSVFKQQNQNSKGINLTLS